MPTASTALELSSVPLLLYPGTNSWVQNCACVLGFIGVAFVEICRVISGKLSRLQ